MQASFGRTVQQYRRIAEIEPVLTHTPRRSDDQGATAASETGLARNRTTV